MVSPTYLRLLISLWEILIPAYNSFSLAFHMMDSVCKLNKQGDNKQPCHAFSVLNKSVVPCKVLTVALWPTYRFLRRQARWSGIPISLTGFQFVVIHTVKGFSIVIETVVAVFLEFPCFFYDPANVGNLISGSSAFSKPSCTSGSSCFT